jgi:hypothetical protein
VMISCPAPVLHTRRPPSQVAVSSLLPHVARQHDAAAQEAHQHTINKLHSTAMQHQQQPPGQAANPRAEHDTPAAALQSNALTPDCHSEGELSTPPSRNKCYVIGMKCYVIGMWRCCASQCQQGAGGTNRLHLQQCTNHHTAKMIDDWHAAHEMSTTTHSSLTPGQKDSCKANGDVTCAATQSCCDTSAVCIASCS